MHLVIFKLKLILSTQNSKCFYMLTTNLSFWVITTIVIKLYVYEEKYKDKLY